MINEMNNNTIRKRSSTSILPYYCLKKIPEIQGHCWPRLLMDDEKEKVAESRVEKKVIKALRRRKRDRNEGKESYHMVKDYTDPPCLVTEPERKITVSSITGRPVTAEKQVICSRMIPEKRKVVVAVSEKAEINIDDDDVIRHLLLAVVDK
eukprot:CAMPEP_0194215852 /NCGR_PEP_ID=MMETSP0156-20130528/17935_1 /TAXON_ID=33649 /ORGANISM="Thalassionema nitzschioides, Strain L26-B" /LENGTH=150 /DNA_ID=CAMNT_0038944483 /DNA_START=82 /DNA_END=535 /DNA_ORIENTATION=-